MGNMLKIQNIFISFLLLLYSPEIFAAEKLPFVTAEWEPYSSSSMQEKGYVAEFVSEVTREMGMEPVIKFYPWSRAQKVIQSGEVFGGFPFGITKQRKQLFNFSDIFLKTHTKFFYDKSKLKNIDANEQIDALKTFTIGVIRNTKTYFKLQEAGFKKIYQVDSVEQAIQMLKSERIQFAALVEHSGWHALNKMFPDKIDSWGAIQFYKMEAALLISKKYPNSVELCDKFNRALKVVQERKTMQRLLEKHGLPN